MDNFIPLLLNAFRPPLTVIEEDLPQGQSERPEPISLAFRERLLIMPVCQIMPSYKLYDLTEEEIRIVKGT